MNKPEAIRAWCEARVGCPYVYGGTGQPCTPSYRKARMAQYPAYAEKIKRNCPRLASGAATCAGCRWCDPETGTGKPAYDCAQLSRGAMEAIGIPMVSGANSQWGSTDWERKGPITELPVDRVCLVYRDDGGTMGHVGIYTGDGFVTHAKGHDWGVVCQHIAETAFTHYGIPRTLYDGKPPRPILRQGAQGPDVTTLQTLLCDAVERVRVDGAFGPETADAVKAFQKANGLTVDGVVGPKTWAALYAATGHDEPAPEAPAAGGEPLPETITISRSDWEAIRAAAAVLTKAIKKYESVG